MRLLALTALAVACCALASGVAPAQPAQQTAGMVKRVVGTVTLDRAGALSPAAVGAAAQVGDTLRTGADGAVDITLADDTLPGGRL